MLHLSEYAAYGRIQAARAARKFPVLLEMLTDGSVTLTTVGLLAPHLTPENHRELLERVRHKSKRQVEEFVAQLRPRPPVAASVRRLPAPNQASLPTAALPEATPNARVAWMDSGPEPPCLSTPVSASASARPAIIAPLAPQRYRVQFTASAETYQKLQLARDLLRHQIPDGDVGEIFDRALTALLQDLARKKIAATNRPRGGRDAGSGSRHIPAEVKRTVWLRDGGRCAFVSRKGRRCTARAFLEFHHVVPYGVGGEATVGNIQLRCRAHNSYEAELYFGCSAPIVGERPQATRPGPSCGSVDPGTDFSPVAQPP